MARRLPLTLALLSILGLAACGGDTPESLMKETVSATEDFASTLEKITDVESAKKHLGDLEKDIETMNALAKKAEAADAPTEEEAADLMETVSGPMTAATERMSNAMSRIMMDPAISEVLQPVLAKLGQ